MLPRIKNQQDLRNSDLEVYCTNIHPELEKKTMKLFQKSVIFKASGGFLKFEYLLNISAITQQIYL